MRTAPQRDGSRALFPGESNSARMKSAGSEGIVNIGPQQRRSSGCQCVARFCDGPGAEGRDARSARSRFGKRTPVGAGLRLERFRYGTFQIGLQIEAPDDADDVGELSRIAGRRQTYMRDANVFQPCKLAFPKMAGNGVPGEFHTLRPGGRESRKGCGEQSQQTDAVHDTLCLRMRKSSTSGILMTRHISNRRERARSPIRSVRVVL